MALSALEKKQRVAAATLEYLQDGMVLGVGTGSTVNALIEQLAPWKTRLRGAVSSSEASSARLRALGIPVLDLNEVPDLGLYIDGADEANPGRELIKGGGGALTREKIIAAATECSAQRGFSNATMFNIAHRAGVTWGAMQHHFGDKDAILDAVIDRSLREFSEVMEGLREAEPSLERRIGAFTKHAWVAFKGCYYRVILDILLHRPDKTERIATAFTKLWARIFGDVPLSQEQQLAAQRFTFMMLSGIDTESVVVPGIEASPLHFVVLERVLLRMLGGSDRVSAEHVGTPQNGMLRGNKNRKGVRHG